MTINATAQIGADCGVRIQRMNEFWAWRAARPFTPARGTRQILRVAQPSVCEPCGFRRSIAQPSRGPPASVPGRQWVARRP